MEALGVLVVVMIAGALVVMISAAVANENARRRESFESASERFGGQIKDSFWSGKSMTFEVEGVPAELTYFGGTDKAPPWTRVHFRWPGRPLRIAPQGAWANLKKFFGAEDILIGDSNFDDAFLIQGEPNWVQEALTPEARRLIWVLNDLGSSEKLFGPGRGINVDVTAGGLILKCYRNHVRKREDLMTFLETSAALLAELSGAGQGGAVISVEEVVAAGKCPVCSDDSGHLSKRCGGCRAAYHRECWDYLGGCAIFGCEDGYSRGEARSTKA